MRASTPHPEQTPDDANGRSHIVTAPRRTKTPQEKKQLSYAKDRRNTYGENSKASRKSIPLSKALDKRAERHAQDQALSAALSASDADELVDVEVRVKDTKPRQWKKSPDEPLGDVLSRTRITRNPHI